MRILFLTRYFEEGSSSRYRFFYYFPYFESKGHSVTICPLLYDGYIRNLYRKKNRNFLKIAIFFLRRICFVLIYKKEFDVILIEKDLLPFFPYFIEKVLLGKIRYCIDFDDAISLRYKANPLLSVFLKNKIDRLSEKASLTTVGNHWYWDEIKRGKLVYLPTVININDYNVTLIKKKDNEIPIIVWLGSPSTARNLLVLKEILFELSLTNRFKLRVIGSEDLNLGEFETEYLQWSKEKEFEFLFSSDIGIMPSIKTPWEYGKCGFKCIQYMASALPVVAENLPANKDIVSHNETGFLASTMDEWLDFLKLLLINRELRKVFGLKGRKRVEELFSYQVWGERYVKYIEKIVNTSACRDSPKNRSIH